MTPAAAVSTFFSTYTKGAALLAAAAAAASFSSSTTTTSGLSVGTGVARKQAAAAAAAAAPRQQWKLTGLLSSSLSSSSRYSDDTSSRRGGGGGRRTTTRRRRSGSGGSSYNNNRKSESSTNRKKATKTASSSSFPPPRPTLSGGIGLRPYYYTCRHTYEDTLIEEISRFESSNNGKTAAATYSPYPGLVCAVEDDDGGSSQKSTALPGCYDPTYALQALPDCVVVHAPSIKGLAKSVCNALFFFGSNDDDDEEGIADNNTNDDAQQIIRKQQLEEFRKAPRGSLALHALVPGMFKGQREPLQQRRAYKVAEEVAKQLKKVFPAARKARQADDDEGADGRDDDDDSRWLLQLLLLEPEVMAASFTRCVSTNIGNTGSSSPASSSLWPNWYYPAGLAQVDINDDEQDNNDNIVVPSSAYRKLLEALHCMGDRPASSSDDTGTTPPVIDLGACPGGWTAALRLMGCNVIAVDRSPLHPTLMKDNGIEFIKGDAFKYEPPQEWIAASNADDTWMVSDVIAYPERVAELLERWCGGGWATKMVITVKFQGENVAWDELQKAIEVAAGHGYSCRAKHFFNNKNEVTLMVVAANAGATIGPDKTSTSRNDNRHAEIIGAAMYPLVLPETKTS